MVKLQSRLERRLPTGCIEIPVALPGIRVFVRARPPRVDLLYSCPHCGETSRGAQEAGERRKGAVNSIATASFQRDGFA